MIKLAMFSGLRRGELFHLKKEHLDFQHGLMTIANPKGGKKTDQQSSRQGKRSSFSISPGYRSNRTRSRQLAQLLETLQP
jgi:integrase